MWDDTNIILRFKPSAAQTQRITYSSYYGMNCAKGGVFLQLCGWLGVKELWNGGISDSLYVELSGILKEQEEFAKEDLVFGKYVPFSLLLDKGYRVVYICHQNGKQECIQPYFAKSDVSFTSEQVFVSATVAADRSGNESRAVRVCKMSGFLRKGLLPSGCPIRLNNAYV